MNKSFMIVVLPDSQRYVEDGFREERLHCFEKQIKWIRDNREKYNICFVTSMGDIVQHRNSISERKAFFECMSELNGIVPYGFCGGNHDMLFGNRAEEVLKGRNKDACTESYEHTDVIALQEKYLDVLRGEKWWLSDRSFGHSNAQTFSALGRNFLALHLEYGPSDETMEWASSIIKEHAEYPTFLTTHMFITHEEEQGITRRESRLSTYQSNMVGEGDNAGIDIWNKLVIPNDNIHFVLCGHYVSDRYMLLDTGSRKVASLISDYEWDLPYYGNGWMRLLTVMPDEKKVRVQTYTPVFDEYRTVDNGDFYIC
ncbi:MAG: metallophosphoesterase [Clostridia bacterium]|nr:metallophosphoesterase [Clostridia bacterium]